MDPRSARRKRLRNYEATAKWRSEMNVDRAVMAFAGIMILVSVVLALYVSPYWLALTGFVGLNLLQASITGFCPAAMIFGKLGLKSGCAFS
jgi:hypothetical protein